ncbi:hypothetical protein BRC83_08895 [Halobacteriales archaeon QS_1_68_17]|nr:MAG: hypothetical protein BRC83_08895 [Halobacteriales archaeon QS_1_68_17]
MAVRLGVGFYLGRRRLAFGTRCTSSRPAATRSNSGCWESFRLSGDRSLRIWNEGDYDDGVTWGVHPVAVEPGRDAPTGRR